MEQNGHAFVAVRKHLQHWVTSTAPVVLQPATAHRVKVSHLLFVHL